MTMRSTIAKATAVALPIGLGATAGHAADLVEVAGKMPQLSTFNEAVAASGLADRLAGEGPFTVFAPTDEAFAQLPQLKKLLEDGQQAELARLLEHHLIDGQAVSAEDVVGGATEVDTMAGDRLTVDGTDPIVLVIPAGMIGARAGDQGVEQTEVTKGSDMPATQHQQAVLDSDAGEATQQTAPAGQMPATQHQQQVLGSDAAETTQQTAPAGQMPATQHQQQVLASDAGEATPQTTAAGQMPATQHQQAVLAQGASVIEADVEADNGVIHVINAVLVPESLRQALEQLKGGG